MCVVGMVVVSGCVGVVCYAGGVRGGSFAAWVGMGWWVSGCVGGCVWVWVCVCV